MDVLQRIGQAGIAPVVVIEDASHALPTARAMLAGGVDVMEITFRTQAAPEAIRIIAEQCPEMLVGAGTVITLDQCRQAVELGAKFIVTPGFDGEVASWCVEHQVPVVPGCVTPSEIMAAMKLGLQVLKFFPASVYGGLGAMKALSGPFGSVKFIPTGGVNAQNLGEYIAAPFIFAVGGSWLCSKEDISAGNYDRITALCAQARQAVFGFEVAHLGINTADAGAAQDVAEQFGNAFFFPAKVGNSSIFSTDAIEVMKSMFYGRSGHIGIRTNSVDRAVAYLAAKGFTIKPESVKYKGGRMTVAYLEQEFGGFAVHLVQR